MLCFGAGSPEPKRAARALHEADPELEKWCRISLGELGLTSLARKVRVGWNPRMRTTAGRAWWPDAMIEMNPRLKDISEEEIQRTLCHELAHLVAYERAGRRRIKAHGVEWQVACADLGIPGEKASHELPFEGRKQQRKYAYHCNHCEEVIERVRKMRGSAACYTCCRKYAGGSYDERFLLVERKL
ncbi:MAG: SprT family zinc-dependent metalloprotease [Haloferula sp.]